MAKKRATLSRQAWHVVRSQENAAFFAVLRETLSPVVSDLSSKK
jgi:hypothetical protein